jgi:TP901 family phage tail tape measure protein
MAKVGEIKAKISFETSEFKRGMAEARSEMNKTSKSAQETKKSLTGIQTGAAVIGTAVVAGIGAATVAAATFEKQMSNVEAVSGATASEMQQLEKLALKLGESTSFSANEAAMGIEELLKAGLSTEQVLNGGLSGALTLASAGNIALADAAEIASNALNSFKDDNLSVAQAADILAGAANASATDVMEMKMGLSQASAVASSVGMTFMDTSTALALFAQNGIKGSDAGTSLKTMLMNLSPSTKEATELMKELGIITKDGSNQFFDAQGNLKDLSEITGVLTEALDDLNPKQRADALKEMFGSDAVRAGSILFKEGAEGVERMADAMGKISAADVAKTKLDNLIGSFEEFKGALETAGIKIGNEFLPIFKEIVNAGTDLVRLFSGLDPAVVATGLKMAGAGAGVAFLLSTIGKLSLAIRGLFVSMGPAGWLILGLSALAALAVGVRDEHERLTEVTLKNADALSAQSSELETSINRFNELKNQSSLTTAEFGRWLDIQEELQETIDPEKIEKLKAEAEKLTEKSGLTNEQLAEMARLNNELTDKVPGATNKITDQGNKVLESTSKLEKYNEQLKTATIRELEIQKIRAENKQDELMEKVNQLQEKLNEGKEKEKKIREEIQNFDYEAQKSRIKELEDQLESNTLSDYRKAIIEQQIKQEKNKLETMNDQLANQMQTNNETEKAIDKAEREIAKLDTIKQRMIDYHLERAGINETQGKGLVKLDKEISRLNDQKKKMQEGTTAKEKQTAEYKQTIEAIDKEIGKLNGAKNAIDKITGAQSGTNRKIGEGIGLAKTLQEWLSKPAYKNVNVTEIKRQIVQATKAYELTRHQGGTLPKFHEGGSPALRDMPSHHEVDVRLLRNEMVLTESQQATLFKRLDNGALSSSNNEMSDERVLQALYNIQNYLSSLDPNYTIELDGYRVGQLIAPHVDNEITSSMSKNAFERGVKG